MPAERDTGNRLVRYRLGGQYAHWATTKLHAQEICEKTLASRGSVSFRR